MKNYNCAVTGSQGLLGSAIARRFKSYYTYPRKDLDYLFLFGSPSSNIIFDQNIDWSFEETINSFLTAIQFCRDNKIKLIYPSSATVYQKNTTYARCKAVLEEIQLAYDTDVLGCRIFAGYGYEKSKGEYSSVIWQFCEAMKQGKRPTIFGDGTQTRDFIFVEDIVDNILINKDKKGLIDIGTGVNTSFNEVVSIINKVLGTKLKPIYVDKPLKYVENTICNNPIKKYTPLVEGIKKVLDTV